MQTRAVRVIFIAASVVWAGGCVVGGADGGDGGYLVDSFPLIECVDCGGNVFADVYYPGGILYEDLYYDEYAYDAGYYVEDLVYGYAGDDYDSGEYYDDGYYYDEWYYEDDWFGDGYYYYDDEYFYEGEYYYEDEYYAGEYYDP